MTEARTIPPSPDWFKGDGCTGVPDWDCHTHACCNEHDWAWWLGGGRAEYVAANKRLGLCIASGDLWRQWFRAAFYRVFFKAFGWAPRVKRRFHWNYDRINLLDREDWSILLRLQYEAEQSKSKK